MRAASSLLVLLPLLGASMALSGCYCTPERVDATMALTRPAEEARTLPLLTSEGTRIAGFPLPVPDSHGWLSLVPAITHNITQFTITELRLDVTVSGQPMPVVITNIKGGGGRWSDEDGNGRWSATGADDEQAFTLYWTVDRKQVPISKVVLPEGQAYTARIRFSWASEDCLQSASGNVDKSFDDTILAAINAQNFQSAAPPSMETQGSNVGFKADYKVKSGVTATVRSITAQAVFLSAGTEASISVVAFPQVSWTVGGVKADLVRPGDTLQTFSAGAGVASAYAKSGTLTPPGTVSGGLYILLEDLQATTTDGPATVIKDQFAYAIPA